MKNGIRNEAGKFVAYINGEVVYSGRKQERVELEYTRALKRAGKLTRVESQVTEAASEPTSTFSINKRFGFLEKTVRMVAKGVQPSAVISGSGGLGKSYTVRKSLIASGLKEFSYLDLPTPTEDNPNPVINRRGTFTTVKGFSTAKGLYRTLFENNGGVIVFDDCDSVLKDPVALNLLKGALDSYDVRVISWNADMRDEDLPRSFIFTGQVVFISNMIESKIDQAIRSRSAVIDVSMTLDEVVERMEVMVADPEFLPQYDVDVKKDALSFIDEFKGKMREVNLRTLITVCKARAEEPQDWKEFAEYMTVR